MPNWCMNTLIVRGEAAKVDAFVQGVKDNPIIANDTYSGADAKPYFSILETYVPLPGGKWDHGLANQYWGTKWSDCNLQMPEYGAGADTVYFMFDSPWAAPLDGIARLSELFPDLIFGISYFEPGMCFAGGAVFSNGEFEYEIEEDIPEFDYDADPDKANDDEMEYYSNLDNRVEALIANVAEANGGNNE